MHIYVTLRAPGEAHVGGLDAEDGAGRRVLDARARFFEGWQQPTDDAWQELRVAIIRACAGRRGLVIHLPQSQARAEPDMRLRDAQWLDVVGALMDSGSRLEWLP